MPLRDLTAHGQLASALHAVAALSKGRAGQALLLWLASLCSPNTSMLAVQWGSLRNAAHQSNMALGPASSNRWGQELIFNTAHSWRVVPAHLEVWDHA